MNSEWFYVKVSVIFLIDNLEWTPWLNKNVGEIQLDYKWSDNNGDYFVGFARIEDATAFSLRFNLS